MKRKFFCTLCCIVLCFSLTSTVFAVGTPDFETGGGSMGSGTSSNRWSVGEDGVRVTIIHADSGRPVTTPVDITNRWPSSDLVHFGKVSKIGYSGASSLSAVSGSYRYVNPTQPLPEIINASGRTNIEAVRSYFTDEQVIRSIAGLVSMDYDLLIGGDYKILVEPLAHFTYEGTYMGTTATEAGIYNGITGNNLYLQLRTLTHKNLPLSIYLDESDLGFPAWSGSTTSFVSDSSIISSLGVGIVRFDEITAPPELETVDYTYRTNTEVITSVTIRGGQSDPDNPTTVTFTIDGRSYNVGNVYYPDGESQLVPQGYFLWAQGQMDNA